MATERQIAANRANATKSTGPATPEGKRASSQNRSLHKLLSASAVFKGDLKGDALSHYNALRATLILELQPHNAAETALIQTMAVAHWRLLCARRIQTTAFRREIVRARRDEPKVSPTTLIAIAFRRLTENANSFTGARRLEVHYDCEYHRALAKLLKLGKTRKSYAAPNLPNQQTHTGTAQTSQLSETRRRPAGAARLQQRFVVRSSSSKNGETRDCDFSTEANLEAIFAASSGVDLIHRE